MDSSFRWNDNYTQRHKFETLLR
ncbi:MAG: hypothetical protein ACD_62C00509G0003, partial [uncultured bacterium]